VWPKIGVGVTVPNFSQRLSFLNSFKSVSTMHRFDFTKTTTVRPFQSAEDSWGYQINFNPLVRITFLTQKNMKIENAVRLKMETTDRRPKQEVIGIPSWPDSLGSVADTTDYFWETPWIHTSLYNDFAINIGDDFTISYPLKLKKGFQLWKWYFKLENNVDLKLTAGYDYNKTIRKEYNPVQGSKYNMWNKESGTDGVYKEWNFDSEDLSAYNMKSNPVAYNPELKLTDRTVPSRTHEWYIRPSASYQFNKMASMSSYIEYRQIHEKLDDETPHLRQILQFEIALMLKFN
jgi:cell surface protein SprA